MTNKTETISSTTGPRSSAPDHENQPRRLTMFGFSRFENSSSTRGDAGGEQSARRRPAVGPATDGGPTASATRRQILLVAVAIAATAAALRPVSALAQEIEAVITADNNYSFGWGTATGIAATAYTGEVDNTVNPLRIFACGSSGPTTICAPSFTNFASPPGCYPAAALNPGTNPHIGVERWVIPTASLNPASDWLYVVTDSDNATRQGLIATFRDLAGSSPPIMSGDAGWEVCATGDDHVPSAAFPSLGTINTWIQSCERGIAGNAATSGGWVDHTGLALGRLFPDPTDSTTDNSQAGSGTGNPNPFLSCVDGAAGWTWYNAFPVSPPHQSAHQQSLHPGAPQGVPYLPPSGEKFVQSGLQCNLALLRPAARPVHRHFERPHLLVLELRRQQFNFHLAEPHPLLRSGRHVPGHAVHQRRTGAVPPVHHKARHCVGRAGKAGY